MSDPTERLPFDQQDADSANAYLASIGAVSFDPFGPDVTAPDLILTTSLADARIMMEDSFTTRNASGRRFRVFPLFVEKPTPNAFAKDYEGLQLCGLNVGLVSAVYELSLFVFSQAGMFRDVGNAAGEASPRLPPDAVLTYWISDRLLAGESGPRRPVGAELVPNDNQRQLGALFLTLLMLRFVWLHELYHCLNGHTGLRASMGKSTALQEMADDDALGMVEVEQSEIAPDDATEAYYMEFDADRTAVWAMVRRQVEDTEPISGILALPKLLRLRLTVFAAVLMTFLFDRAEQRRVAKASVAYPIAYHRLHNLVRTIASNLMDAGENMRQAFAHTVVEMDYFQSNMPASVSGAQLIRDLRAVELQREFDSVENALAVARLRFASWAFHHLRGDPSNSSSHWS